MVASDGTVVGRLVSVDPSDPTTLIVENDGVLLKAPVTMTQSRTDTTLRPWWDWAPNGLYYASDDCSGTIGYTDASLASTASYVTFVAKAAGGATVVYSYGQYTDMTPGSFLNTSTGGCTTYTTTRTPRHVLEVIAHSAIPVSASGPFTIKP